MGEDNIETLVAYDGLNGVTYVGIEKHEGELSNYIVLNTKDELNRMKHGSEDPVSRHVEYSYKLANIWKNSLRSPGKVSVENVIARHEIPLDGEENFNR